MNTKPHIKRHLPSSAGRVFLASLMLALAMNTASAAKGGNGQSGNGGGGGGNDTPDPDYLVAATNTDFASELAGLFTMSGVCKGTNPDLKGPGIAYRVFFPTGCTATTSSGEIIDRLNVGVFQDEFGYVTALEFKGLGDGTNYYGYFELAASDQMIPPASDSDPNNDAANFSIEANAQFTMDVCGKVKGKQVCSYAGEIYLDTLVYEFVSF